MKLAKKTYIDPQRLPRLQGATLRRILGYTKPYRLRAASVIDTAAEPALILAALARALDPSFRASLGTMTNPYDPHGDGQASRRIVRELKAALSAGLASRKRFADTPPLEISS